MKDFLKVEADTSISAFAGGLKEGSVHKLMASKNGGLQAHLGGLLVHMGAKSRPDLASRRNSRECLFAPWLKWLN